MGGAERLTKVDLPCGVCTTCRRPKLLRVMFDVDGVKVRSGKDRILPALLFCSRRCLGIYNHRNDLGLWAKRKAFAVKKCVECGREYAPSTPSQIYCSVSCARKADWGKKNIAVTR